MNQRFAFLRRPVLVMVAVFLAAMVPLGWVVQRLHREAVRVDGLRIYELAQASYKSLLNDRSKHQVMLQTWVGRLKKAGSGAAVNQLFDELGKRELGRFRSVGYAEWTTGHKLEVRYVRASNAAESLPIGTDLAVYASGNKMLALEASGVPTPASNDPSSLPSLGERVIAVMGMSFASGEKGAIFATILPDDFLLPTRTSLFKINPDGTRGAENVLEENLPGVGEGIVRIDSVGPDAWDAAHHEVPLPTTIRLTGTLFGDLNMVFRPGPKFARDSLVSESWLVLGIGSLVAVLFAVVAWMQARQSSVLRAQVVRQTTDLLLVNMDLSRFKAIADTTSDFVGMCELDGTPIYVNMAGRAMLGIAHDEPIHLFEFPRIYPPQTMALFESEGFAHAMEKGPWSCDLHLRHSDGRDIPVSFVGFVVKSPDGRPLHMASMARDITSRRELDQQLRASLQQQLELVQLKSQFVNTVSHEFRTPLGVILTSADILTHYLDRLAPAARMEHLGDIHRASIQMSGMLDQVLDLGRIEAGKHACTIRPLDLPALLHRITDESHSASTGCRIELKLGDDLVDAQGDESLLRHIFFNILSNARKYSPRDAVVVFTVRREGDAAIFTVHDRGIGIPAAAIPHLFEAFSRADNVGDIPGTGLGLAIVKRCTELHGGTVQVESEEGQGTLVTIRLPLFDASHSKFDI